MLILTRKLNESIIIDGRVAVKVLRIDRDQVKLGVVAPAEVGVHRWEIFEAIQAGKQKPPKNSPTTVIEPPSSPKKPGQTPH